MEIFHINPNYLFTCSNLSFQQQREIFVMKDGFALAMLLLECFFNQEIFPFLDHHRKIVWTEATPINSHSTEYPRPVPGWRTNLEGIQNSFLDSSSYRDNEENICVFLTCLNDLSVRRRTLK